MRRKRITTRRRTANHQGRATVFLAAAAICQVAYANNDNWIAGSDNWSNRGNWSLDQVPGPGNIANLSQSDSNTRVVTYDAAATTGTGIAQLWIDATGSGSMTLSQSVGTLSVQYGELVGMSGRATYTQNGGFNTTGGLDVGYFCTNGTGTYNLNGGSLSSSQPETVGFQATGTFNQIGGGNTTPNLYLGYSGSGTNPASYGTYNLGGGVLAVSQQEYIGYAGTCVFNQAGGSNTTTYLELACQPNVSNLDTYNLSNGATLSVSKYEEVGEFSNGIFNQSGGSNSAWYLYLGFWANIGTNPAAIGTFNLSNGTLTVSDYEQVGVSGIGTFNQSGGSNSAEYLSLGYNSTGTNPASQGTYNLSNGATLSVSGGEYIGGGGMGTFNQTGGSNTTVALYIAYQNGASGTYSLSGGVLASTSTVNAGQFTQSGGTANLGTVTGSGTMTLGGATEQTKLSNFQQNSIAISSGGYLAVASNTTQYTNTVTSLSITGSGRLDLANQTLITTMPSNTIRQYLIAGANIVGTNPAAWNGSGGISSINAAASTNHLTALGYSTGTHSALGISLGLASNQTVVKYTIYGDANLDGTVDINDLNTVLSNYLSGNPATWDTGDFNYDNAVDINDLNSVLTNYLAPPQTTVRAVGTKASASTASTAHTLTGTVSPADTVSPPPASGVLELVVNVVSGDVELEGNNADIASLQITSNSGGIITANWTDLKANGYANWTDTAKKKTGIGEFDNQFTVSGDYAVLGVVDYGDIYNTAANAEDYVFKYGSVESNDTTVDTDVGSVIYVGVPEPTTLGLMGLAAAGLMRRRRSRL